MSLSDDYTARCNALIPKLQAMKKATFKTTYRQPSAVVLPGEWKKHLQYEGADGDPNFSGTLMGLPVEWVDGAKPGLRYEL